MRKLFLLFWGLVFFAGSALAQHTVSGKVTDDKGAPLSNVSVQVKGTRTGTVTKADGTYTLAVPAGAKTLVFSAVGMDTYETAVGTAAVIDAKLKQVDKTETEVVVTAFGIKKDKKTLGYGITQLSGAELNQTHGTNLTNSIASKVPGVRTGGSGGSFS
ncbi:MAG TPA: carboxypeptidase-like regulatory domain-containing protein, partial [Chitinophagaceae bacterium]|nr:carboxypeptidase-like regulatory domain-containing protein [Chitinophagaceae bacterium]